MKFNELRDSLNEQRIDEGILNSIKKAVKKFKTKLNASHFKLVNMVVPTLVGISTITPVSIQAAIYETAEKLGIELEADELVHLMEIIEHVLHIGFNLVVAHKEVEDEEIIKE